MVVNRSFALTEEHCQEIGIAAGYRSMRKGKRRSWNDQDFAEAAALFKAVSQYLYFKQPLIITPAQLARWTSRG
jgi:hypothetical protein